MNFTLPGLVDDYQTLKHDHTELVLATIVDTEGSTYRKAGARMLVTADGVCHGVLGGDELHKAVIGGARPVFKTKTIQILDFGARHKDEADLAMELEPGARVTVMLEYLSPADHYNPMELLAKGLQLKDAVLVTICESAIEDFIPGTNILITRKETMDSNTGHGYYLAMSDIAQQVISSGHSSQESCITGEGSFTAFYDIISPAPHLLVIGAGPDAIPVLRLARALDWTVTIVDTRQSCTRSVHLAAANQVLTLEPAELPARVDLDTIDAVVIMTHRLDLDEQFLQTLQGRTELKYIGLLGTERRREKLLQALALDPDVTGEKIYGPVGLDLGARSPEQIALSILSEIQAVLNNGSGGRLSGPGPRTEATPAINEDDLFAVIMAAGGSRRFGGIKQLLELDGKSLLKRVVDTTTKTLGNRVKLVLGIKPNKLQREADGYDIEIVVNRDWENGIASSLRAGIKSLPAHCKGALIVFCDQPRINEQHLRQMIDAWKQQPTRIIACSYAGTQGVPVIFPSNYFASILELQGDNGAKSIIEKNPDNLTLIPVPEAEIDIDTQEDLIKILKTG